MNTTMGDLMIAYGEVVQSNFLLIPRDDPPVLNFYGRGKNRLNGGFSSSTSLSN